MREQVFISYRNESAEHARGVRQLADRLRATQIPIVLDQYFLEENPGGPDVGWPKWCEDAALESECVLVIASEGWFAAWDKRGDRDFGLGAATEADLFRQFLYDEKGQNDRIRLTFVQPIPTDRVPVRLRAWHHFRPFEYPDDLDRLIRWISDRLGIREDHLPPPRWPQPIEFQPDLANRDKDEWPAVVEALAGRSSRRILLFEGDSGIGKSELLREIRRYAKQAGILVSQIDFKLGFTQLDEMLGMFALDTGEHLPNFSREGNSKTLLLRKDLRLLRRPLLFLFDTYERTLDEGVVADWLNQHLLPEVETSPNIAVIIGGQKVPQHMGMSWREYTQHFHLKPIKDFSAWEEWVSRRYPTFQGKADLRTLITVSEGYPLLMSTYCGIVTKD